MAEKGETGEQDTTPEDPTAEDSVAISQWEFLDRVPTREDVVTLLETLPDVWGIRPVDFADWVQALPQSKKSKKPHPDPDRAAQGIKVEQRIDAYTLYMSVAGRLKMLEAAAQLNDWIVDFEPEPVTPTGCPGFISLEQRIVYREYVVISRQEEWREKDTAETGGPFTRLGRKSGTAWVPQSGGNNAAGSNPYEKVETSARGRALAAWGFGVLPGSGVASLEEVIGAGQNRQAMRGEETAQRQRGGAGQTVDRRESREEIMETTLAVAEELRQERGISVEEATEKTAQYLSEQLGIRSVWNDETKEIDWVKVKDGQLVLLRNSLTDALRKLRDAGSQV